MIIVVLIIFLIFFLFIFLKKEGWRSRLIEDKRIYLDGRKNGDYYDSDNMFYWSIGKSHLEEWRPQPRLDGPDHDVNRGILENWRPKSWTEFMDILY